MIISNVFFLFDGEVIFCLGVLVNWLRFSSLFNVYSFLRETHLSTWLLCADSNILYNPLNTMASTNFRHYQEIIIQFTPRVYFLESPQPYWTVSRCLSLLFCLCDKFDILSIKAPDNRLINFFGVLLIYISINWGYKFWLRTRVQRDKEQRFKIRSHTSIDLF